MEPMLLIFASSTLRDTPAKQWDSLGWKMYLMQSMNVQASEEDKLKVWKMAIDDHHERWTTKYRQYAKSAGIHANYSEEEQREREEKTYAADRDLWEDVQIKKIEAIDGMLKFFTETHDTFEMDIGDLYSQVAFRKAYSRGTMKILPAIKTPSYEKFISTLQITKIEDTGITLLEKIEEHLQEGIKKMGSKPVASEEDAIKAAELRAYSLFNGCVYFRIQSIANDLKRDHHNVTRASIVSALRDLGATQGRINSYRFWKYDLGSHDTESTV